MNRIIQKTVKKILSLTGYRIVAFPSVMKNHRDIGTNDNVCYNRHMSMMLAAREINHRKIGGHVAELGVYRGDFAKEINRAFPNRKLYLFDTFEGFDQRDIKADIERSYSVGEQDFSKTSVDFVLNRMMHPENCRIVKGFFPDSLDQIPDRGKHWKFCFVSIEADLYEPIYAGLCYFHPRLERGGYIFVHDFLNDGYRGAAEAVRKFAEEYGAVYCVLPDATGTACFCTPPPGVGDLGSSL